MFPTATAKKLRLCLFPFRGKKRDKKRIKEYNGKKIKEAEQTQREIAQLKKSHENVERAVADLKEKHYNEITVMELDHLQDLRKVEAVVDCRESELAKQKDLVEALNQELDYQDHELSLERSRYFTHTTALRQLYEHERKHIVPTGIRMPVRRRR